MIRPRLALFTLIMPALVSAYQMSGRVLRVDNGNTLTIVDSSNIQHTVHLQNTQAPGPNQSAGIKSRQHLQQLVEGRHVVIDTDASANASALSGRVYLGNTDVNLRQIEAGMARFQSTVSPADKNLEQRYQAAQDQAQSAKLGLWYGAKQAESEPQYERRLMAPSEAKVLGQGDYPPLSDTERFKYRTSPADSDQVVDDPASLYAPLTERQRMFYGYRNSDGSTAVMSTAQRKPSAPPASPSPPQPPTVAPRLGYMPPPFFAPSPPYWIYPRPMPPP